MNQLMNAIAQRRQSLKAIGRELTPEAVSASERLWAGVEWRATATGASVQRDLAYGEHERHRLDLFLPPAHRGLSPRPVFLFVPGGGFTGGDKHRPGSYLYDNIGQWAASCGWAGVNINYRLAPGHTWPAASADVATAIRWLKQHASELGIDMGNLILAGHSAGAAHVASCIAGMGAGADDRPRAAVLLSGVYDISAMADRPSIQAYYGSDPSHHRARSTLDALATTDIPLFISTAEEDPDGFQAQALTLLQRIATQRGRMPAFCVLSEHNHFTQAFHIGSNDQRLTDLLSTFIEAHLCDMSASEVSS